MLINLMLLATWLRHVVSSQSGTQSFANGIFTLDKCGSDITTNFSKYPGLVELRVTNSPVQIQFATALPSTTQRVVINYNALETLNTKIFAPLINLRQLDLKSNRLREVDLQFGTVRGLTINLQNNTNLKRVSIEFLSEKTGRHSIIYNELLTAESFRLTSTVKGQVIRIVTKKDEFDLREPLYYIKLNDGKYSMGFDNSVSINRFIDPEVFFNLSRKFDVTSLDLKSSLFLNSILDLSKLTNLASINLSGNKIEQLTRSNLNLPDSIRELDLVDNPISYIQQEFFVNLKQLYKLELAVNSMTRMIENLKFYASSLKWIIIISKKQTFTFNLIGFMEITLDRANVIVQFMNTSSTNSYLEYSVTIENSSIDFEKLSSSKITYAINLKQKNSLCLVKLIVIRGNVHKFNFTDLTKLSNLNFLKFESTNLNVLSTDTFKLPENITKLDLSSNKINFIQKGFFEDMANLQFLNLDKNKLVCFVTQFWSQSKAEAKGESSNNLTTHLGKYH
jgi:Leucine-rich repeat (LRR) protein